MPALTRLRQEDSKSEVHPDDTMSTRPDLSYIDSVPKPQTKQQNHLLVGFILRLILHWAMTETYAGGEINVVCPWYFLPAYVVAFKSKIVKTALSGLTVAWCSQSSQE